jgi:hypothetical protein
VGAPAWGWRSGVELGERDRKHSQTLVARLLVAMPMRHLSEDVAGVRADCLATNTEYCDRCMHATTQATNVVRIKTEGTKGLLNESGGWVRVRWNKEGLQTSNQVLWLGPDSER